MAFLFSKDTQQINQELKNLVKFNLEGKTSPTGQVIKSTDKVKIDEIEYDEENSVRNRLIIKKIFGQIDVSLDYMNDGNASTRGYFEITNSKPIVLNLTDPADLYFVEMHPNLIMFR